MNLFGISLDNELNFKDHISSVCKKINNQFSVFKRFGKLISSEIMLRLYKAFILPHFHYCSMIWHFCNSEDSVKLDTLNRRMYVCMAVLQDRISVIIQVSIDWSKGPFARFQRRATAVPNSVDRIKFDFYTAVTRRLKPSRATAV